MPPRELDEHDVRVRPGRGSRPRTKQRPAHADAVRAFVTGVDRGRYQTLVDGRTIVAMKARDLGPQRVVPGDEVDVVGDLTGQPGTLARIVRIAPRRTVLRRTADDADPSERVIVANADQLVVVTALADPTPRTRMIDRCVVAAYDAGMDALLVLTKADRADPAPLGALYAAAGVPSVVTRRDDGQISGLDALHAALDDRVSVLVGHSGVGKSTLVNALVPGAGRATGEVNEVTGRGRHVSTSAVALRLPASTTTWVIDTPGVRSFGLAHVDPAHLLAAFTDLAQVAQSSCPRGCTHLADSPDCALDEWVDGADAVTVCQTRHARLDSLRRLLVSRQGTDDLD
ncbi:MAG: ribosome small subunit-dependent GTPase A [Micrococcales bacterium]|nr:ribosome small subunit-dependent GTPase A [Micrococcales bacterium]MCL2666903.1 ribosome small subunit-dependent GTPase A [Micrococcales bacterium]